MREVAAVLRPSWVYKWTLLQFCETNAIYSLSVAWDVGQSLDVPPLLGHNHVAFLVTRIFGPWRFSHLGGPEGRGGVRPKPGYRYLVVMVYCRSLDLFHTMITLSMVNGVYLEVPGRIVLWA